MPASSSHQTAEASPGLARSDRRKIEVIELPGVVVTRTLASSAKRGIDLLLASVALVLLAPVMLLIALLVKSDSRGPVLYRSPRTGRYGERFGMLKFRTMVVDADIQRPILLHRSESPDGILFKMQHDPRLTRLGRLLRVSSLDELPQLFQVLTGTMSLVGPRPLPPEEDEMIRGSRFRRYARPGITGPWQVAGSWRVPLDEMVELDDEYLSTWSVSSDIALLARTVVHALRREGV